ncbi:hypothetical protein BP6252_03563 [Coleophoma cylindrospora]|uniref:Major facilitator superfamily (MFS) profile domain-containing protein n=1 Tax=Coleophoma cylindrospora TaxID=1849047 RepID=A0A3D8S8J0_9HELO|nr:hypothetical protein BP6252_03563 [Coleophoma cylindrospora]
MLAEKELSNIQSPSLASEKNAITTPIEGEVVAIETDEHNHSLSQRVTRKCDFRLVPILCCLYLTAFLDRANLANARLLGLESDLHMPSNGYNTALWSFYLTFTIFEVPSNVLLSWSKCRPNVWLGTIVFMFGTVTMCQGFTKSAGGLYACRAIMGTFEGGLAPAAALLMGQYYRRSEFGIRYACFTSSALIGSAFSGFLAYAIEYMDGIQGIAAWRWIFIIEGLLSVALGSIAFIVVPGFPGDSKFLTKEEKAYLLHRLEVERGVEATSFKDINWNKSIFNWKIWINTLAYFCIDMSAASISSFSPTILKQLGWTSAEANIHSIPIWLVGAFIALNTAIWTGKVGVRFPFVIVGFVISIVGWAIELVQVPNSGVRYFALYLIAAGAFLILPILVLWLNNNIVGRPQKAVATALQIGFGNSCNFVASNVFITGEAPRYPTGFKTGLGLTVVGLFAVLLNVILLWRENKEMDRKEAAGERNELDFEGTEGMRFRNTL